MKGWEFQPARDLNLTGIERWRSLQREHGLFSSVARLVWWFLLRAAFYVWHRPVIIGREHLPLQPPFMLIANHSSHLDALLLASLLPAKWRDKVSPVAASDTFFDKHATAAFAAWILNALAIRRRGVRSHDLSEMRDHLARQGAIFIIFPEGTRSRSGEIQTFKSGIGRLVAASSVPVVPCYLDGCFRACPPSARYSKPFRLTVKIGKPLVFQNAPDNRAGWDAIAQRLQREVECLAEEYGAGGKE
ncbi:MAG: lysophospholipid acyltransferase family protein [Verrucomicrobiaceae bacterium]|jgi:1-acyl-sn-glycerol-3-phosphate acyltransferase|nr:lysophospholipid acyltransferase family protein [Verrucomicrobiaceae bacterium]